MTQMSPLAIVISQLFPMFLGTVTLSVKEITTNKNLIVAALRQLQIKLNCNDFCIDNSRLYAKENVLRSDETLWQWFADNFLSLTFVKEEGVHFSEHPVHRVIVVASSITKLYNRFQLASEVTDEEQDTIHSLKHKFEDWGHGDEFGTTFNISLEEIAIMQRLLTEYYAHKQYSNVLDVSNTEPSQYWILNTRNRIKMNIEDCIEDCIKYLNTLQ